MQILFACNVGGDDSQFESLEFLFFFLFRLFGFLLFFWNLGQVFRT